ncbi:MAG TPA: hypothetical protein PK453_24240 [Leptospiraceae bacterium]|nr:hypothetical protein [Leptospiraceae bacterium]HNF16786.1 hypothetical protein [Leptospiraceae bacterium]HNF24876.1 hypothetical protein [Leptospiraceae bacterium]HNM04770.1 hypothetical protein [Leptospiraceae bacterium]HNN06478.1 hypothetical protein [Leptospiraceae bacterium]
MKNFITLELWQGILKNRKVSLSSFFFFFILSSGLGSETVILNNNEVIKGKLQSQSEKEVVITDSSGKRTIPKDQVHKILYKDPDEKELRKILDANKAAASAADSSSKQTGSSSDSGSGISGQKKGLSLGGDLFFGNYTSDWEKRTNIMYLVGGRVESDWKNKTGLGARLFMEYVVPLSGSGPKNYFFRGSLHRLSRDFSSNGFGASTIYSSKYNAVLGMLQAEGGVTFEAMPNFRVMPKLTLSRISQDIDSSSSGTSLLAGGGGISRESGMNKNLGLAVTLGLDLEYDLKNDLTVFGNLNLFSPYFYNYSKGHQSNSTAFSAASVSGASSAAFGFSNASGNVSTSLTGYSVGLAKRMDGRLRIFAALETMTVNTKITGVNSFAAAATSAGTGAVNFPGTIYPRVLWAMEESIQLQGLRFGIVYDLASK